MGHLNYSPNVEKMGFGHIIKHVGGRSAFSTYIDMVQVEPGMRTSLHWHRHQRSYFFVLNGNAGFVIVDTSCGEEYTKFLEKNEWISFDSGTMHQVVNVSNDEVLNLLEFRVGAEDTFYYKMGDDIDPMKMLEEKNKCE